MYWEEDESFIEYFGHTEGELNNVFTQHSPFVDEYAKFFNHHYDFVEQVDDRSACPSTGEASDRIWWTKIQKKAEELLIESKKITDMFSLAKKPTYLSKGMVDSTRANLIASINSQIHNQPSNTSN